MTTTTATTSPSTAATALAAMDDSTEINPTSSLGSDASSISNVQKETNQGQLAPGQSSRYDAGNLSSSASPYMVPITTVCLSAAVASMITW